ncbi:hypothetical protein EW146_g3466 [Bondarzewia mesenterica]|uniref:Fatty acid desaturase domain-containing protein n=1 Tax=Bondarzewia mesenterica TaxID=1095465 RepID=A0A4V3XFF5_9AGAM|nr:hypothetical protein EW146_g3466 [Bondarzewia mesenterica]
MFSNGLEYEARLTTPFAPPTVTLKQIHDAVPKHLLQRSNVKAALYVLRDIILAAIFLVLATKIDTVTSIIIPGGGWSNRLLKAGLWGVYWWFQGLVGGGIFCLGHDAGHGTLFDSSVLNHVVGFVLHSFLLIPYYAWRQTHHAHHKATGSIERDENYVPHFRTDYNLPPLEKARRADYAEVFEETPIWTLARVLIMQGFGWWLYLSQNTLGSRMYPPGTNHFNPNSLLFKKHQRNSIIMSDIGISAMAALLSYAARQVGWMAIMKYYFIPYIMTNHWIVMFTYLHHSDPTIPHYFGNEWTFLRGAAATVDRPLLGWMGRFFLHNISHDHVAHHFFVGAPFYNGPAITRCIRGVLKDEYNFDSTNTFYALWRSFSQCLFIEEFGGIVFYKNKYGEVARELAEGALGQLAPQNVRYDTRGHGRSGKPDTPDAHLSRLYADDFMAVVHAFALKNPIFVSWSNGGLIAADICANVGPLPISGIFYLSALPHAFSLITGGATPYLLSVIASCEDLLTTTAGLLRMVDGCFASPHALPPTFQLRCFYAGMQTLQSKEVRNAAARRSQDVDKLWENMELDGKVLEREVRPHAKNFDVKVVEGRGHALFWEIPQDTAKVIIEFVTRAWKDTYDDVSA